MGSSAMIINPAIFKRAKAKSSKPSFLFQVFAVMAGMMIKA
jgi:hypothetical protein